MEKLLQIHTKKDTFYQNNFVSYIPIHQNVNNSINTFKGFVSQYQLEYIQTM